MINENIYIVRHGECRANVDKRITGVTESPLTPNGLQQAHRLGGEMVGLGINGIVTSTVGRASQTAEIIGAYTDVPVVAVPHFRAQSFGILEGHTLDEARQIGLGEYLHKPDTDKFTHYVPGGETAMEVQLRVMAAVDVIGSMAKKNQQKLTVVAHNSVVRSIAGGVWGLDPKEWTSMTVPNCDILKFSEKERFFDVVEGGKKNPDNIMELYELFKQEGMYRTRSRIARLMSVKYPGWEQVAEQMIKDGYFADAVEATQELNNMKDDVLTDLLPQSGVVGIIHYGSSSHSPFYAVKKSSDLDFDVIVKDGDERIADAPLFEGVRERFTKTLRNANNAGADICSFKFNYKEHPISMRVTKEDVFREICTNNPSSRIPRIIREFRDTPKPEGSYYAGRYSFDGEEHSWFPRVHQVDGGVVSLNPVSRVDNRGRYVNGVTVDKYLSQPQLHGDVDVLSRYLFQATTEIVKRLIQEENEGIITNGSLVNLMARHDTMPKHAKQSMAFKEQIIREMIGGGLV